MVIPIKNFISDTIEVSSLHVMVYMISFNKISLLVVTSFNDYDNIHNVIMIMVTPIGNSHIRYNRSVIFAWDAMYNTFQSCVSTCIPNIISYLINAPHSRAPATDMSVSGARESAAHTSTGPLSDLRYRQVRLDWWSTLRMRARQAPLTPATADCHLDYFPARMPPSPNWIWVALHCGSEMWAGISPMAASIAPIPMAKIFLSRHN